MCTRPIDFLLPSLSILASLRNQELTQDPTPKALEAQNSRDGPPTKLTLSLYPPEWQHRFTRTIRNWRLSAAFRVIPLLSVLLYGRTTMICQIIELLSPRTLLRRHHSRPSRHMYAVLVVGPTLLSVPLWTFSTGLISSTLAHKVIPTMSVEFA
jgi:hypothetical protein